MTNRLLVTAALLVIICEILSASTPSISSVSKVNDGNFKRSSPVGLITEETIEKEEREMESEGIQIVSELQEPKEDLLLVKSLVKKVPKRRTSRNAQIKLDRYKGALIESYCIIVFLIASLFITFVYPQSQCKC